MTNSQFKHKRLMMSELKIKDIARICHEAYCALCVVKEDDSQVGWDDLPEWQRKDAINCVIFQSGDWIPSVYRVHENWMDDKIKNGWVFGCTINANKKTHPCLVAFDQLKKDQHHKVVLLNGMSARMLRFLDL